MEKKAKIAGAATVGLLAVGGLAGGLTASLTGGTSTAQGANNPTSQCYLDEAPQGRVGQCDPLPVWLKDYPFALDKDNQPLPFAYQGISWMPQIAGTSGAFPDGTFCPPQGTPNPNDSKDMIYYAGCEPFNLTWVDATDPSHRLMPDGQIVRLNAQKPDNAAASSLAGKSDLQASSLYNKWKAANPKEWQIVEDYWNCKNQCTVPVVKTPFGKAYLDQAESYHYSVGDHS